MHITAAWFFSLIASTCLAQDTLFEFGSLFYECEDKFLWTQHGQFNSPLYPNNYPEVKCGYNISADDGFVIEITFHDFDLHPGLDEFEETADRIEVLDGMEYFDLEEFFKSTNQEPPYTFLSSTNNIYISFTTDAFGTARGFNATYESIPSWLNFPPPTVPFIPDPPKFECSAMVFGRPVGQFTSPFYPAVYPESATCEYIIGVEEGHIIEITFHDVDLVEFSNDKIIVEENDMGVYLDYRSNTDNGETPAVIRSKSNLVIVRFESKGQFDSYEQAAKRGFSATYESWKAVEYCDSVEFAESGPFTVVDCQDELRTGFHKTCRVQCNPVYILRQSSKVTCVNGKFVPSKPCKMIDFYIRLCEETNMAYCQYSAEELAEYFTEQLKNEKITDKELSESGLDKIPDPFVPMVGEIQKLRPYLQLPQPIAPPSSTACSDSILKYSYCAKKGKTNSFLFPCNVFFQIKQIPKNVATVKMKICYKCRNIGCTSSVVFF